MKNILTNYIKYYVLAGMIVFAVMTYRFGGKSTNDFNTVSQAVEQVLDTSLLEEVSAEKMLKKNYNLALSDYDGAMVYMANYNMSAEEVVLIRVKNDSQITEVEDAISRYLDSRKNVFGSYLPSEAALVENAVLMHRGGYIFMAISENADEYRTAFVKNL